MAFFKFRLPANASAVSDAHSAASGESVEAIRRRARHRLMGAVVLVFVAVVAFPLLFDAQPRPVAVDTPILIPDRQNTPALAVGQPVPASQSPAKPLLAAPSAASAAAAASAAPTAAASVPSASSVPAPASLEPGKEEVVAPSSLSSTTAAAAPKASAPAASAPAKVSSQPAGQSEHKSDSKHESKAASKPADDGLKAKALLEGKDNAAGKVVIQVGAFGDADKVREVRRKLEQAGLKTYTQTIEGKDGKRSTRVRVGPFDSRDEADKAAARVRKLDLPANLIAL